MKRELMWYQRNLPDDAVRANVRITTDDGDTYGKDVTLSDATLCEDAKARGADTWSEVDICAALKATMPEAVKVDE